MDNIEKMVEGELTAAEKLEQFEKEKLTRRQALARFGFQAGATLVATLTADDLLRAVGKEMKQRAGDNKVAQQVAKELSNAGMVSAVDISQIKRCQNARDGEAAVCWAAKQSCGYIPICWTIYNNCMADVETHYQDCLALIP
jgi:hypothetical protein